MALVTYIDGIPTFSTKLEALAWGQKNLGIKGSHIHIVGGQTTFMAGISHSDIKTRYTVPTGAIIPQPLPTPVITPTQVTQPTPPPASTPATGGGSTGGGGGGGY
jgi:hypothetical protein|tara:strand:- start:267 stop:581 length:315 start_codon:yes stop_codon:yes gene_type:complete